LHARLSHPDHPVLTKLLKIHHETVPARISVVEIRRQLEARGIVVEQITAWPQARKRRLEIAGDSGKYPGALSSTKLQILRCRISSRCA